MPLYERASAEVYDIGNRMMEQYHGELRDAGVTIDFLFARKKPDDNGEINPELYALKLHGYPVAAMVRVNNYKNRVLVAVLAMWVVAIAAVAGGLYLGIYIPDSSKES